MPKVELFSALDGVVADFVTGAVVHVWSEGPNTESVRTDQLVPRDG